MPQASLRAIIASTAICLFGSLLLGPTIAMAEYNVNEALAAYDAANPNDRKTWELVFGNTANGINWANTVLFYRKQEPLYCPPDNFAPAGPQVIEMLRFQMGAVGYVYKQIGCDSGSGDRSGCFQSQVVGVGPQLGFIFPVGDLQGYLNLKYYNEFAAENRPHGWNTWVTFTISPAAPSPSTSTPKRIITK